MKSKIIGKKQILTFTLMFALVLAVFVNWYYTKSDETNDAPEIETQVNLGDAQLVNGTAVSESENYFNSARLNRTKAHESLIEMLEKIINDANSDEETKTSARNQLVKMSEQIKYECDIENSIKAQIDSECIAIIDNDKIEIILEKGVVNNNTLIKVKDIVINKTNIKAENITIIELKE